MGRSVGGLRSLPGVRLLTGLGRLVGSSGDTSTLSVGAVGAVGACVGTFGAAVFSRVSPILGRRAGPSPRIGRVGPSPLEALEARLGLRASLGRGGLPGRAGRARRVGRVSPSSGDRFLRARSRNRLTGLRSVAAGRALDCIVFDEAASLALLSLFLRSSSLR